MLTISLVNCCYLTNWLSAQAKTFHVKRIDLKVYPNFWKDDKSIGNRCYLIKIDRINIPHIQQAPGENEVEGGNLNNGI